MQIINPNKGEKFMKRLVILLLLCIGTHASAEVENINVCGTHLVSMDAMHFMDVQAGSLQNGLHKIFATNQRTAKLLASMENNKDYCVVGGFNFSRPNEGMSLIAIQRQ
jgi:hypothetical protein